VPDTEIDVDTTVQVDLTVNGERRRVRVEPRKTLADTVLSLPIGPHMGAESVDAVADAIRKT